MKTRSGFTLVELIMVIVILGVLAAVVVPRFVEMHREARIATVDGALAALKTANTLAHGLAVLEDKDSGIKQVSINGTNVRLYFGWIMGTELQKVMDLEGFSVKWTTYSVSLRLDTNCEATYTITPGALGKPPNPPVYSRNITGC